MNARSSGAKRAHIDPPAAAAAAALPETIVDLSKLETAALRRYRRHFKLPDVSPNSSKEQLLDAVIRHFASQQHLDEFQVISRFAKRLKS